MGVGGLEMFMMGLGCLAFEAEHVHPEPKQQERIGMSRLKSGVESCKQRFDKRPETA